MDENVQTVDEAVVETTGPKVLLWVTDGTDNLRVEEADLPMFLSASPGWRRGRSGAFKKTTPDEVAAPIAETAAVVQQQDTKLFLITGLVRMEPLVPNRAAAQAEQHRLVWANNLNQAMEKYTTYFTGLGTQTERYTVLNMAASEAIQ